MNAPLPLRISLQRRDVLRALGYPRSREPSARVAERLDALWEGALALADPRGIHLVVDAARAETLGIRRRGDWVALGVCTAGESLERESRRAAAAERLLDALILDAVGSAAAEAAASALNGLLCAEAHDLRQHLRPRFSPGYRGWDLAYQRPLLELLEARSIGVTLTEGLMMMPRKSVSFAARMRPGEPDPGLGRCTRCGLQCCRYRDEPASEEPK